MLSLPLYVLIATLNLNSTAGTPPPPTPAVNDLTEESTPTVVDDGESLASTGAPEDPAGDAATAETPTTAMSLSDVDREYRDRYAAAQAALDEQVRKLRETRLTRLRTLLDETMTRKDLTQAVQLRTTIDEAERELGLRPLSREEVVARTVDSAEQLRRHLAGTKWEWSGESLHFLDNGTVRQTSWQAHRLVTSWQAVDRRTVVLRITQGRDKDLYAVLTFDPSLTEFDAMDFGGGLLKKNKRLRN